VIEPQVENRAASGDFDHYKFDVFISYSRRDSTFARRLYRALTGYTPPRDLPVPARRLRVFLDETDFQGTEYHAALEEMLQSTAKLLVICSPASRASRYCWRPRHSGRRRPSKRGKRVLRAMCCVRTCLASRATCERAERHVLRAACYVRLRYASHEGR
jgi:hypothetical protein